MARIINDISVSKYIRAFLMAQSKNGKNMTGLRFFWSLPDFSELLFLSGMEMNLVIQKYKHNLFPQEERKATSWRRRAGT